MSPQRGHARGLQIRFQGIKVHQIGTLLEFLQLVDPQVEETTRFNPKGVPLHCSESWSTHFLYYLSEVSHVPQWLSFPLEQPILQVVRHVFYGYEYDLSLSLIREIFPLIVQKPIHEVSHISGPL